MKGWMTPGIRRAAWVILLLAALGFACGVYLIFAGGDWPLLGAALVAINTFNGGRIGFELWEDRFG